MNQRFFSFSWKASVWLCCLSFVLSCGEAFGQSTTEPAVRERVALTAQGSYLRFRPGAELPSSNLAGWDFSADYWVHKRLGFVADVRGYQGNADVSSSNSGVSSVSLQQYVGMAGPELGLIQHRRFSGSFRFLVGASSENANLPSPGVTSAALGLDPSATKLAFAYGGSSSILLTHALALRISPGALYTRYGAGEQHNFMLSAGLSYRFGRR